MGIEIDPKTGGVIVTNREDDKGVTPKSGDATPPISSNVKPTPEEPSPTDSPGLHPKVGDVRTGFEVSSTEIPSTPQRLMGSPNPLQSKPTDAVIPEKGEKMLVGMENNIEMARRFNEDLHKKEIERLRGQGVFGLEKLEQTPSPRIETKSERIRQVLKAKGMDSQQQNQAMVLIDEILNTESGVTNA